MTDIDLAGLEDDPDFWNMNVGEEILPVIRDLTKGAITHARTKKNVVIYGKHCRDGLPEKHKKRFPTEISGDSPKKQRKRKITEVNEVEVSTFNHKTKDRRLEKLELLHEQSNVSNNLQLLPGHRLKLQSSAELERSRKSIPDFKLDYTDLYDIQKMNRKDYDSAESDNDEDDLPEAAEILSVDVYRKPLPATSCANSDINSLIRAVPLDDELPTTTSACIENEVGDQKILCSSNKRKKAMEPRASNKRIRGERLELQSQYHEANRSTLSQEHSKDISSIAKKHGSLFLPDDIDELENDLYCDEPSEVYGQLCSFGNDDIPFVNSDYLDRDSVNADLTVLPESFNLSRSQEAGSSTPISLAEKPGNKTYEEEKQIDDFAELDHWLNSGAVEIL
ncbi:hypothetical protein C0992_000703 [Termitomyces sp. T32_za158]|nr:hypothetical protein C0992_000703 [Termitomyces sp. T32_za158]